MLELEDALAQILAKIPPAETEDLPLTEAGGRVAAGDIASRVDLPPFDNSAMDGYAVRSQDVVAARSEAPVTLRLAGRIAAGEVFAAEVERGSCVRIFTGSLLPRGSHLWLPIEWYSLPEL